MSSEDESSSSGEDDESVQVTKTRGSRTVATRSKRTGETIAKTTKKSKKSKKSKSNADAVSLASTLTETESRLEEKTTENKVLKDKVKKLEEQLKNANRRMDMIRESSEASKPACKMTDEMKHLDLQFNSIMNSTVIRWYKFAQPGMEQWSDNEDCVARLVVDNMHFPAGTTIDQKKEIWEMFLSVKLRRKIQIYRGKLVQSVKNVFKDDNDRPNVERLMKVVNIDVERDYQDWSEDDKSLLREFVIMQIKYGR
eukprot:scaffold33766_cov42-Cyclotella_meneghiniana.AAC.5